MTGTSFFQLSSRIYRVFPDNTHRLQPGFAGKFGFASKAIKRPPDGLLNRNRYSPQSLLRIVKSSPTTTCIQMMPFAALSSFVKKTYMAT
jgi:hypothetical protein